MPVHRRPVCDVLKTVADPTLLYNEGRSAITHAQYDIECRNDVFADVRQHSPDIVQLLPAAIADPGG